MTAEEKKEHTHYESECESDLEKDDILVLSARYNRFVKKSLGGGGPKSVKAKNTRRNNENRIKSHWTRIYDEIQEHFSSHVNINQISHLLPPNIYAMKQSAKQSWLLYKKRECERRKRLRLKIETERAKEEKGEEPGNILLSMVDSCECCRKLYVSVNLFWGSTLCDICYFNPEVIQGIVSAKSKAFSSPMSNVLKKVCFVNSEEKEKAKKKSEMVKKYFTVSETASSTHHTSKKKEESLSHSSTPEIIEESEIDDDAINDLLTAVEELERQHNEEKQDTRPISTYTSSSSSNNNASSIIIDIPEFTAENLFEEEPATYRHGARDDLEEDFYHSDEYPTS